MGEIRKGTLELQRQLLLDQIVPMKLALRAYSLGTQIDNLQLHIVEIYPDTTQQRPRNLR
jgi:hypothetical protein